MIALLPGRDVNRETEVLKGHLWRNGPTAWPLATILAAGHTLPIHTLSMRPITTHPANSHPINTHPINAPCHHTPCQYPLPIHPLNTPYQPILSPTLLTLSQPLLTPPPSTPPSQFPPSQPPPLLTPPSTPPLTPPSHNHPLSGNTKRDSGYNCDKANKQFAHLGLGSASHMSSVAEPSAYWLKRGNDGG